MNILVLLVFLSGLLVGLAIGLGVWRRARRRSQEELTPHAELRKRLEVLVASQAQELREARDEAERASRAKSRFLANMTHEIRTPMNAVLGYAQLLKRDRSLGEAQQRKLDAILSSGDHLMTVITSVLEMSRIEAGRATLVVAPFDLRALLAGVRRMFASVAREKGLELAFDVAPDLPAVVEGDAGKVRQVVINLLGNAAKFTRRGRIGVRTTAVPVPGGRHRVTVEVEDTGSGIEPEVLPRVFEAFEQANGGQPGGGSGLGLSTSREFARLMHGDVSATSTPGVGSTFTFVFEVGAAAPVQGVERIRYDDEPRPATDRPALSEGDSLASLLQEVPEGLVSELREAVVRARARRVDALAAQIADHSPEAAARIRTLAGELRLDKLASALDASSG